MSVAPDFCPPHEMRRLFQTLDVELPDVVTHSLEVAGLCRVLANRLSLGSHQSESLVLAATFHDIGKFFIPRDVLYKPGPLSQPEFEVMMEHVEFGERYVSLHSNMSEVSEIIGQHHERVDGKGYPHRLPTEKIHPLAKLLVVVDSFCAMTEHRSYNTPRTIDDGLAELRKNAGSQFDPNAVEAFCLLGDVLYAPRKTWMLPRPERLSLMKAVHIAS